MRGAAFHLFLLIIAACSGADAGPSEGRLEAHWIGTDTGRFRAPASASWCVRDTLLELFATRNDTAVGLILLPRDSLTPGRYSVLSTEIFIALRPQAGAALRYLDPGELKGFEGASGTVTVSDAGRAGLSGTFEAALRRTGSPDTLRISGSFAGVPVGRAGEMCGRANRPSPG